MFSHQNALSLGPECLFCPWRISLLQGPIAFKWMLNSNTVPNMASAYKEPLHLQATATRWQWSHPVLSRSSVQKPCNPLIDMQPTALGWCMGSGVESIGSTHDMYNSAHCKIIHNLETIYMFVSREVNSVVG